AGCGVRTRHESLERFRLRCSREITKARNKRMYRFRVFVAFECYTDSECALAVAARRLLAAQLEKRMRASCSIQRRSAHDDEPEPLVEADGFGFLFVHLDGECTAAELLRVRDQTAAASSPSLRRLEKQRLDRMLGQAEETNGRIHVREHPPFKRVS